MRFDPPLAEAVLLARRQRFLADVRFADGTPATAHCPNTGSMMGCAEPGSRVWLSRSDRPGRKYALTWELVEAVPGTLVGIHTHRSNGLVLEAIEAGRIARLAGYDRHRREVRYGSRGSRIDLLLEADGRPPCHVEVKNVTAAVTEGIALFPDAPSERGVKHLEEMIEVVAAGGRAVLVFCVQRADVGQVRPADAIDPRYGEALRRALSSGVEAVAWRAEVSPEEIALRVEVPVVCP